MASEHSDREDFSIRLSFKTGALTRDEAKRVAAQIVRQVEKRATISHCYSLEVANEADDLRYDDES